MTDRNSSVDFGAKTDYPQGVDPIIGNVSKNPLAQAGGFFGAALVVKAPRVKTEKELSRERIAENEKRQSAAGNMAAGWEHIPCKKILRKRKEHGSQYRRSNGTTVHASLSMKTVLNQEARYFAKLKYLKEKRDGKRLRVWYMPRRLKPSLYLPDGLK